MQRGEDAMGSGAEAFKWLSLALQWLETKDVARSTQVCRAWRKEINKQEHMWKQAAMNVSPLAFEAVESATNGKVRCKDMATALARLRLTREQTVIIQEPTITASDILVLVEIKTAGLSGAWCKSLKECENAFELDLLADERAEFAKGPSVVYDDNDDSLDDLTGTLSLLRLDTCQSVVLDVDHEYFEEPQPFFHQDGSLGGLETIFGGWTKIKPTFKTKAGIAALELMEQKSIDYLGAHTQTTMVPSFGTVSKYQFTRIKVVFQIAIDDENDAVHAFDSMLDFLLYLEGLDWQ